MKPDKLEETLSQPGAARKPTAMPVGAEPIAESFSESERYTIRGELGRGGMGVAYRVFDRKLQREVALKVLGPDRARSEEASERLAEEARTTAGLAHPAIVPVYDCGRNETGRLFYTMKLVEGRNLAEVTRSGDCTTFGLVRILLEVTRAVAFAHQRGVLHRDLKPQNVMIGPFGEVQVMDWGLSVGQGDASGALPPAAITSLSPAGTPGYMAPELKTREPDSPNQGTDVFALGATLCFLLSGKPPEPNGSLPRHQGAHPSIPPELRAISLKAMEPKTERRYRTASELADDLQAFLEGLPVSAFREGVLGRATKFALRHRAATATLAACTLVGLILSALGLVILSQRKEEADRLRLLAESRERATEESRQQAAYDRDRAEKLVGFMLFNLSSKLRPIGRLDIMETVAVELRRYYADLPPEGAGNTSLRQRAVNLSKIADVLRARGDLAGALIAYENGLQIAQRLAAAEPSNPTFRRDLFVCWERVGTARGEVGATLSSSRDADDLSDARDALEEAVSVLEALRNRGELPRKSLAWLKQFKDHHPGRDARRG